MLPRTACGSLPRASPLLLARLLVRGTAKRLTPLFHSFAAEKNRKNSQHTLARYNPWNCNILFMHIRWSSAQNMHWHVSARHSSEHKKIDSVQSSNLILCYTENLIWMSILGAHGNVTIRIQGQFFPFSIFMSQYGSVAFINLPFRRHFGLPMN